MLATEVRPSHSLQRACLASGLTSSVLSLYFWNMATRDSAGFAGPWFSMTAILFSALAVGAFACWGVAARIRRRRPGLAEAVMTLGSICGLVPPALTAAFVLLQTLG